MHPQARRADQRFREALAELGATPMYDEWTGSQRPHAVRCVNGHLAQPWPAAVFRGQGICRECVGMGAEGAWARFRERMAAQSIEVLEPEWLGATTHHRIRCSFGHESLTVPNNKAGCGTCARRGSAGSASAWDRFREVVAEHSGEVLEPEWLGTHTKHRVRCAGGHVVTVAPSKVVPKNRIPCRQCTRDRCAAEYLEILTGYGCTDIEPWRDSTSKHQWTCSEGHPCSSTPAHVRAGVGPCRACAGKVWDVFYVVRDAKTTVVKLGISSGNPRPRLGDHARNGLDTVERLHIGLPGSTAPELEHRILVALREAGERPVKGVEYFPGRALPLILRMTDAELSR